VEGNSPWQGESVKAAVARPGGCLDDVVGSCFRVDLVRSLIAMKQRGEFLLSWGAEIAGDEHPGLGLSVRIAWGICSRD
jgi:hypothetical protein